MKRPLVSIIMNAYNGAEHLGAALDSVLAQDWPEWELVFWDDRSSDDTAAIFANYSDARFRYFLAPAQTPLGRARIDAVAQARGEWLAYLDQDDVWTADKLSSQMALALEDRGGRTVGLVYGRAVLLQPSGRTTVHDHRHEHTPLPEGDIFRSLFVDSCYIGMSTAMVRTEAYRAVGGISPNYDYAIDYHLFLALARRYDARALQRVCCWYRVHSGTLTQTRRAEVHREVIRILEEWRGSVDPRLLDRRLRVHQSLLAYEEARSGRLLSGLGRLLRKGSPTYVASRPFARGWRAVRRTLRPTRWEGEGQRA